MKHYGEVDNVLQNNSFVILMQLPLLCEKTGVLTIVELGLMAGKQTIRQTKMLYSKRL